MPTSSLLPPCRAMTNCYSESRAFDRSPDALFTEALSCLRELSGLTIGHAVEIERDADLLRLHAPFSVFLFTDDLDLRVEPREDGAMLHARSASRLALYDLGINRRRVRALFDALAERTPVYE